MTFSKNKTVNAFIDNAYALTTLSCLLGGIGLSVLGLCRFVTNKTLGDFVKSKKELLVPSITYMIEKLDQRTPLEINLTGISLYLLGQVLILKRSQHKVQNTP